MNCKKSIAAGSTPTLRVFLLHLNASLKEKLKDALYQAEKEELNTLVSSAPVAPVTVCTPNSYFKIPGHETRG